jgi:hypothetical protein
MSVSHSFAGDNTTLFELMKTLVSGRPVTPELVRDFRCP